jgi:hypothetical protein
MLMVVNRCAPANYELEPTVTVMNQQPTYSSRATTPFMLGHLLKIGLGLLAFNCNFGAPFQSAKTWWREVVHKVGQSSKVIALLGMLVS